jgi:Ras-related protein Rab-5C
MDTYSKYKVVIIGDTSVGKSSILSRFVYNSYSDYAEHTIGASFLSKKIVNNNEVIKFDLWDTAGQERYRSLVPMYYRDASVIIIVYDITSMDTFNNAKIWAAEAHEQTQENSIIVIVGNKSDKYANRKVDLEEVETHTYCIHKEVSAKTGAGIEELFLEIGEKLNPSLQIPLKPNIFLEKKKYNFLCF